MMEQFEKAQQLLGVSVPRGDGEKINGDGGEVAVGASVKSAESSPKKTLSFRGRCGDCGEKGHRWRDCPKRSECGGDGVRKGSQQSQDGSRSSDSSGRSGKARSDSSEKPTVVLATAVLQEPSSRTRPQKREGKGPWSRTRMRQQGGVKSVSHSAVFEEPVASEDDGGG